MNLFSSVAKNTLAQVFGRAGVVLITVFVTAILTRLLGVAGYGNYVFIISLILFFVALADWGTSLIFVREVVKHKEEEKQFFGNALLFRLGLALVAFVILNLLVSFLPIFAPLSGPIRLASLLLILICLKTSCHIIFQAKLRFEFMAVTDVVISLLFLMILIAIFFIKGVILNLFSVLLIFIFANFFGSLLTLFLAARLTTFNFKPQGRILKLIILEAIPTGTLLFVFSIYNRLDIFLLQFFKGATPVGVYGLAYKVHDNLILGAVYLTTSLFPLISAMAHKRNSRGKLAMIYRKTFDLLLIGGLFVLMATIILAPVAIAIIGGPGFGESVLVLRLLVLATFIAYLNHLTGYTLVALGKQRVSLLVALLALALNLFLNLLFIPRYSYLAAAVITIITEAFVFSSTSFYLRKKFLLTPQPNPLRTFLELWRTRGKFF